VAAGQFLYQSIQFERAIQRLVASQTAVGEKQGPDQPIPVGSQPLQTAQGEACEDDLVGDLTQPLEALPDPTSDLRITGSKYDVIADVGDKCECG
jgi:hypothetical protein